MKLRTVTITGADDSINSEELVELSHKYPFVEWGILLSSKREGSERYPSENWINELSKYSNLRLSGHICGRWARDIVNKGVLSIKEEKESYWHLFKRIQINHNTERFIPNADFLDVLNLIYDRNIIMQVNNFDAHFLKKIRDVNDKVIPLFDLSGGNGVFPTYWPKGNEDFWHGYSGGISSINIEEVLIEIDKVSKGNTWIDLESGCRTENNGVSYFDLDKAEFILRKASKYISSETWYDSVICTSSGRESLNP